MGIKATGRRSFLKGSLVAGATMVGTRGLSQEPAPARGVPAKSAGRPDAQHVQAEAGTIADTSVPEHALIRRPGSDYMVDHLKAAGIRYVAATPGSTFRGLHESIVNYGGNKDPEFIVCVHEEISAAFAHGYAKAAGQPMACLLHSTVGLTHAAMALYNAWCDRVPMIALTANILDETKRRPGVEWVHTATDLGSFVRDFIKWDDTPVSLAHYGDSFMRAVQITTTPPNEPVMLVVDGELQEEAIDPKAVLPVPRRVTTAPPGPDAKALAQAAVMLIAAERPLIIADRLARSAEGMRQLVKLAELLNAPVVDKGGRLNMPTNHYLNHSDREKSLAASADVILGLELTDLWGALNTVADTVERRSVRFAAPDARVIGISALYAFSHGNVQDLQRFYPADLSMASDGETTLPSLIAAIEALLTASRRAEIAQRAPALRAAWNKMRSDAAEVAALGWDASPISTARLSMELWQRIRNLDWALVSDSIFVSHWPQRLWEFTEHHQYIGGAGGYGMGYGAPAAAGAAIAHRDAGRIAINIQTDGDLMVLPGTLWTLAHHKIPLLTIMHNNRAWHQETMHLKRMSSWRDRGPNSWKVGTVITDPDIDYAAMARSMGLWAEGPISDPKLLGRALDRALDVVRAGKPALVDVLTQPR